MFFRLSFLSFSLHFAAVIELLLDLLPVEKSIFWESIIKTGKCYHGVATCSYRQFCYEFFTQISEHFCGPFRIHWADHWKDVSCCLTWVQMMPILVRGDDVISETKVNAHHSLNISPYLANNTYDRIVWCYSVCSSNVYLKSSLSQHLLMYM